MSIETLYFQNQKTSPVTIIWDIKIHVACNTVHLEHDSPVDESLRPWYAIEKYLRDRPWYADIVNNLAADVEPEGLRGYTRKKFLREVRRYHWDEPYLCKHCSDEICRRCVAET